MTPGFGLGAMKPMKRMKCEKCEKCTITRISLHKFDTFDITILFWLKPREQRKKAFDLVDLVSFIII